MTNAEYKKEVKKLIKKIDDMNDRCKGLVLDYEDLTLVQSHIGQLEATLQRNLIMELIPEIKRLRDMHDELLRRIKN